MNVNMPRTTKREVLTAFRTREILAAARQLLEQDGGHEVTMEEIAALAGVAKGTLYLYFRGKEELIQALLSQVGEEMEQGMEEIMAGPGAPQEKLSGVLALLLHYVERERVLFPLYLKEIFKGSRPGQENPVVAIEKRVLGLIAGLFAEGIARDQFLAADPMLLTFLLRGLVRATGLYQMAAGSAEAVQQAFPVVADIVLSGFLKPASREAGEAQV
jgi:AcrR family transcriptional regulator